MKPANGFMYNEVVDLVQASTLEKDVPMVYCYMHLDSRVDLEQLKCAVTKTARTIPQILCEYHPKHDCWCSTGHTVEEVVKVITSEPTAEELIWDLTTAPQIRIFIRHIGTQDKIIIAVSHIVMDGSGFQQYMKLLMDCYNQKDTVDVKMIDRNWLKLCSATQKKRVKKIGRSQSSNEFLLPPSQGAEKPIPESLYVQIDKEWMNRLVKGTKSIGVTMNDFLLAGYAETIVQMGKQTEIIMPVPADIRRYCKELKGLTIANMTGKYQCPIRWREGISLVQIAKEIHQTMEGLKRQAACLHQIDLLRFLNQKIPRKLCKRIIKRCYHIEPVSYSNLGKLQMGTCRFGESQVVSCYISGKYRLAPSFQVTVSTYEDVCTLSINLIGTKEQRSEARRCLQQLKKNLYCALADMDSR